MPVGWSRRLTEEEHMLDRLNSIDITKCVVLEGSSATSSSTASSKSSQPSGIIVSVKMLAGVGTERQSLIFVEDALC
jgi:hypothetical protein